jgi:hypothetical protein
MARIVRRPVVVIHHPSGQPLRRHPVVSANPYRIPEDGFVTPRLRKEQRPDLIGFVHSFDCDEETD